MAAGCAVVANEVGDAVSLLDASCLVAVGDVDGLVVAITRLLRDDVELEKQQVANYSVAAKHDLDTMTKHVARMYETCLASRGAA